MDQDKRAELSEMAVQLYYLREDLKAAGQPLLAHLIGMAAAEAERLGAQPKPDWLDPAFYVAGGAEKPGG